jgi:oxalate decarboxylase/phosphoglucose isomerase-like protein (cupin superfamily)
LFHEGPSGYAHIRRHEDELVSSGAVEEPQFFECVSVPGETVYVPDMWWHATLNIGQMVSTTHIEVPVLEKM